MLSFVCNICGAHNHVDRLETEPASCACGSNVRLRALIHLLSMELFGRSLPLKSFPKLKAIRGIGISDHACYAEILAEKFDYTNTFYDREPRFDVRAPHPELAATYDFVLAADVLEHIAPPIEAPLQSICDLLKPTGFFGVTIYCNPQDQMREHFPELNEFRLVNLGESTVLVNRRSDGTLEVHDDVVLHLGPGSSIEMREYGITELTRQLRVAGFSGLHCLTDDIPDKGIVFDHDVSQPLIAVKQPFMLSRHGITELIDEWREARQRSAEISEEARLAVESRWLRLGKALHVGPRFRSRNIAKDD